MRTNISNAGVRNRLSYAQSSYGVSKRQPKMRGSFPKTQRWSLGDEGVTNKRLDYNRAINLSQTANKVRPNISSTRSLSAANFSKSIYDGNAARKLNYAPAPKKINPKPEKKQSNLQTIKGAQAPRGVMQGSALSPFIVGMAKLIGTVFCFLAIVCFVRVGLTAATVSQGIESQEIATQVNNEQIKKNALEVQNSTLSNSGRIKQAAADYNLSVPPTMTTITLPPDVLAYSGDDVSLVESLNRLAQTTQ